MEPQNFSALIAINAATLITIAGIGVKIVRHMTRMEWKVNMMWRVFEHRFHIEDEKSRQEEVDSDA